MSFKPSPFSLRAIRLFVLTQKARQKKNGDDEANRVQSYLNDEFRKRNDIPFQAVTIGFGRVDKLLFFIDWKAIRNQ